MKAFTVIKATILYKLITMLTLGTVLSACSSTGNSAQGLANSTRDNSYYTHNFSHTSFTTFSGKSIKKPLSTDQQLMMSLLNRPMTEDQAMMLAFTKTRESFSASYARGIAIKGKKSADKSNRNVHHYSDLIAQDRNAIIISAPH